MDVYEPTFVQCMNLLAKFESSTMRNGLCVLTCRSILQVDWVKVLEGLCGLSLYPLYRVGSLVRSRWREKVLVGEQAPE